MRYSKTQLGLVFLSWPDYKTTTNLDRVEVKVDVVQAVARERGMSTDCAERLLDKMYAAVASNTTALAVWAVRMAQDVWPVINANWRRV